MYDSFLSNQWLFDRCLEIESIFIPLNILISILVIFLIFLTIKTLKISKKRSKIIYIFSFLVVPIFIFIITFLLGTFNCSAYSIWGSITPALKLDEKIKRECLSKSCPRNINDLQNLDKNLYSKIISNAKIQYIYDSKGMRYAFYVQPSKYYMGVFKDGTFSLYKMPSLFPIQHWDNIPIFQNIVQ